MRTAPQRGDYGPIAAVIGWPVGHSLSPLLHRHWLAAEGIAGEYVALAVAPDALGEAVTGLKALGFVGANVTIPHKTAVLAHADRIDPLARRAGAANLILRDERGRWIARNTDVAGVRAALEEVTDARDRTALLLGAGGAARAAAVALLDAGVGRLVIANRHRERAEELARDLADRRIEVIAWHERNFALASAELVVNATSLGMKGMPPLALDLSLLPAGAVVFDLVYQPLETALVRQARARGLAVIDGLKMLVHQAVPAFAAFYGRPPADIAGGEAMLRAHLARAGAQT
ncbi:MAG: shikimate dehydrogenase (NADP(+)) [Rhodothalassiaceae bacterium]|nr:MAG: shikimate dehydrogenase (NADP(+)) [Rhodothalassiaceae bacterium]